MAPHLCQPDNVLLRVRGKCLEMGGPAADACAGAAPMGARCLPWLPGRFEAPVDARVLRRRAEGTFVRADSGSPRC